MYWGLVCLAVSLVTLPFAAGAQVESGEVALIVSAVFAALSVVFFAFGRRASAEREPRPADRRSLQDI